MAYALGAGSRRELAGVHPRLIAVAERAIVLTTQDFAVHDGLRTEAEQRDYVKRGVSKTMASKHMRQADGYGHAVDLVPFINGKLRWEWPAIYPIVLAVKRAAAELGVDLRWGGTWQSVRDLPDDIAGIRKAQIAIGRFDDGPHFEMAR